jgi:hypothetical protein
MPLVQHYPKDARHAFEKALQQKSADLNGYFKQESNK